MGDGRGLQTGSGGGAHTATTEGQSRLDAMLSDARLMAWLETEERRRRKARRRTMIGVIAMTFSITAAATWFTVLAYMGPMQDPEAVRHSQEGWQLWQAGNKEAAEAEFAKAVEIDPRYDNAWNGLGWSRFNQGDSKGAEEAFQKCVELVPTHPAARNGLGWICFQRREYEAAEKHWKPVAGQATASWPGLAKLYLLTGNWDEAVKWCEKASAQAPGDKTFERMLAAAQARKLDDGLRSEIEPPPAGKSSELARKGWMLFQRGRYRDAQKAFEEALKEDPKSAQANNGLGFCLLNQGKHVEAKTHFERALETWPDGGGPLNGLARCLKAEGRTDEAIAIWKKVADDDAPNAGNYGLAQTYLELGKYEEAVKYWEQIVKAQPNDSHAKESLERAKRALEDE